MTTTANQDSKHNGLYKKPKTVKGEQRCSDVQIKEANILSKERNDVSDEVSLFLQLVIGHHWHHFVIILCQVEVSVLPLRQEVRHVLKTKTHLDKNV